MWSSHLIMFVGPAGFILEVKQDTESTENGH